MKTKSTHGLAASSVPVLLCALLACTGEVVDGGSGALRHSAFNRGGQGHADVCVRLRHGRAALRFPDGTRTGLVLTNDMLVYDRRGARPLTGRRYRAGSGAVICDDGYARLDAREFLRTPGGRRMLFHRGGWGFVGHDPGAAARFGHILLSDINQSDLDRRRLGAVCEGWPGAASDPSAPAPPCPRWRNDRTVERGMGVPIPSRTRSPRGRPNRGNGDRCPELTRTRYRVRVASIPSTDPDDTARQMHYWNSAGTAIATTYRIYGNSGSDLGTPAQRALGIDFTLLSWSWVNRSGGGVARALLAPGQRFRVCRKLRGRGEMSVRLDAMNADGSEVTGWVRAVYGAARVHHRWLYGWVVKEHSYRGGPVVHHLVPERARTARTATVGGDAGAASPCPAASCIDDLGRDVCEGGTGLVTCPGGVQTCTCDSTGHFTACGTCIPRP